MTNIYKQQMELPINYINPDTNEITDITIRLDNHGITKLINSGIRGRYYEGYYSIFEDLPEGKFKIKEEKIKVYIKVFDSKEDLKIDKKNFYEEKTLLEKMKHKNLFNMIASNSNGALRVLQSPKENHFPYIIQEKLENIDFFEFLTFDNGSSPIAEDMLRVFFKQILEAINFLNLHNINHLNLNCKNLLLNDNNFELKLPDLFLNQFTLSPNNQGKYSIKNAEIIDFSIPPELSNSKSVSLIVEKLKIKDGIISENIKPHTTHSNSLNISSNLDSQYLISQSKKKEVEERYINSDIYYLGIFLFNLMTLREPFQKNVKSVLYDDKLSKNDRISKFWLSGDLKKLNLSTDLKDLITKMLDYDNITRISFEDIFSHPWLQLNENINNNDFINYCKERLIKLTKSKRNINTAVISTNKINNNRFNRSLGKDSINSIKEKKQTENFMPYMSKSSKSIELTYEHEILFTSTEEQFNIFKYILLLLEIEEVDYDDEDLTPSNIACTKVYYPLCVNQECSCGDLNSNDNCPFENLNFNISLFYCQVNDVYFMLFKASRNENLFLLKELINKINKELIK